MSAADEARAVLAEAAWSVYRGEHGYMTVPTSPDTGADFSAGFEAGWDVRDAEVERLTAKLQAAQAAIKAHDDGLISDCYFIEADTSAHDAAILAAKNEAWDEACQALAWCFDNGPERDALPYMIEHSPFRASIEGGDNAHE